MRNISKDLRLIFCLLFLIGIGGIIFSPELYGNGPVPGALVGGWELRITETCFDVNGDAHRMPEKLIMLLPDYIGEEQEYYLGELYDSEGEEIIGGVDLSVEGLLVNLDFDKSLEDEGLYCDFTVMGILNPRRPSVKLWNIGQCWSTGETNELVYRCRSKGTAKKIE